MRMRERYKVKWTVLKIEAGRVNFRGQKCGRCQCDLERNRVVPILVLVNGYGNHVPITVCDECRPAYKVGSDYRQ